MSETTIETGIHTNIVTLDLQERDNLQADIDEAVAELEADGWIIADVDVPLYGEYNNHAFVTFRTVKARPERKLEEFL